MSRATRYSKITTLNQLRNERARLESDITNKEFLLNLQYRDITEYFSIANMISLFVSRINSLTPLWTWAQSAFNFIRSLFKNDDAIERPNETKQRPSKVGRPGKKQSVKKTSAKQSTKNREKRNPPEDQKL